MDNVKSVLCDVHFIPMELVSIAFAIPPQDKWESTFYGCGEPSCVRHFNPTHGYVDIREHIDGDSRKIRGCSNEPRHFGSVAIVAMKDNEPVWDCIYADCKPKKHSPIVGSVVALG